MPSRSPRLSAVMFFAIVSLTAITCGLIFVLEQGPGFFPEFRTIFVIATVALAAAVLAILLALVQAIRSSARAPDSVQELASIRDRIERLSASLAAASPHDEASTLHQEIASLQQQLAAMRRQLSDVQAALTVLTGGFDEALARTIPLPVAAVVGDRPDEAPDVMQYEAEAPAESIDEQEEDTATAAEAPPAPAFATTPRVVVSNLSVEAARSQIENDMSIGQWDEAIALAGDLADQHPGDQAVAALRQRVSREYELFRESTVRRLYEQFKDELDRRQYRRAVSVARRLMDKFADHKKVQKIRTQLPMILENAEIEERQEDEARIQSLIRGKRFHDAVELSEALIAKYPLSPQAESLDELLPRLRQLAIEQEANSVSQR